MEFQYKKALDKYNLEPSDLPEDAQTGIEQIIDVQKTLNMLGAKGKTPTEKTMKKIKALDKWVYYEILDFVNEEDENDEEMPDGDEIADELKNELKDDNKGDNQNDDPSKTKGLQIEKELETMFNAGMKNIPLEEIRTHAKATYDLIWETYEDDEENGVETTHYSLIEKGDSFILTKKS